MQQVVPKDYSRSPVTGTRPLFNCLTARFIFQTTKQDDIKFGIQHLQHQSLGKLYTVDGDKNFFPEPW